MASRTLFAPLALSALLSGQVFAQDAGTEDTQQENPHHVKNRERKSNGAVDEDQARAAQEENPHATKSKERRLKKGKATRAAKRKAQEDNPDNPESKDRPLAGSGATTEAPDAGR